MNFYDLNKKYDTILFKIICKFKKIKKNALKYLIFTIKKKKKIERIFPNPIFKVL